MKSPSDAEPDTVPGHSSRADRSVLYRQTRSQYPVAVSAVGVRTSDAEGKQYLDMSGGAAVSCLGHGHREVVDAIADQLDKLAFAHTAFFTHEPQEQLATKLAKRFGEPGARVYFLSGGSEANETALKAAWQYWAARGKPDKKVVISREHSYHGNTFGALSVSGNAGRRRASAAPLYDWPRIPPCYPYREMRDGETLSDYAIRAANYLEEAILEIGADSISAFICEPVVGSSLGVVAAPPGYLRRVREICDRHDVLLIADEIMCGSGRTGSYFAHEHDEIVPDMVTLAKGIGGGYVPLAAVVIRSGVAGTLVDAGFAHGHTYIGHPLACAAGLAVQRVIDRDRLLMRVTEYGERFLSLLSTAFSNHENVGEIRGRGLFAGIELVSNRETRDGFANRPGIAEELRRAAMDQGLICYPGSISVDELTVPHIMLAPPFIAEDRHLAECVDKLKATLAAVL
jgi:adenosylmethionine-8-amino-7-oxononanoate aminotransferase